VTCAPESLQQCDISTQRAFKRWGYRGATVALARVASSSVLAIVRYIDLNPIRATIVESFKELDRSPWSGHRAIMGKAKCPWMDIDTVLSQYRRTRKRAITAYRRFVGGV